MSRIFHRGSRVLGSVAISGFLLATQACQSGTSSVGLDVEPKSADMAPLTTQKFSVSVSGTLDSSVTWSLRNATGLVLTDPKYGSIALDGRYTAPAVVPRQTDNDFFVMATSTVDHTRVASALIHVIPAPINPARGPSAGGTRIAITGSGFSGATQVHFGANAGTNITVESSSLLRVTTPASTLANLIGVTDVKIDNGDGHPVVYPQAFHYGATLLRLGGGQLVPTCNGSFVVATGDFNGDGKIDAASICAYDQKVAVFLNNSHGGVKAPIYVPTTYYEIWDLQVGDVDGNGTTDLVIAFDTGIQALLNDGTGVFTAGPFLPYPGVTSTYDVSLAVADFDGDGKADAAFVLPQKSQLLIAKSTGAGQFGTPQTLTTLVSPFIVRAAKIRGAAAATDLLVSYDVTNPGANNFIGGFQVATNNGTGTFAMGTTYPSKVFTESLAVADFNGDGKLDVVTGSQSGDGSDIGVRLGDGAGAFGAITYFPDNTGNMGVMWRGLAAADVDGDLKADVIDLTQKNIDVLYGQATPTLTAAMRYPASDNVYSFALADLGDGVQMIIGDYNQLELYVRQPVARTFGAPALSLGAGATPESLDLHWQNQQASVVAALFRGNAGANGGAVSLVSTGGLIDTTLASAKQRFDLPAATTAGRVVSADIDLDTLQDAIISDDGSNAPFVANSPMAGAVYIMPGKLDGSLGNTPGTGLVKIPFFTDSSQSVAMSISDVQVSDIDGDGFPDLIAATNNARFGPSVGSVIAATSGSLQVRFGSAAGFGKAQKVSAGLVPSTITLADLDGDGRPEILTSDHAGNRLAIVKFDGQVARDPLYVDVGNMPSQVLVTDVNGDYIPDLVVLANYLNGVEIDVIAGLGTVELGNNKSEIVFDVPDRYRFLGTEHTMGFGDIDGDGLGDIALTMSFPPSVAVLRGHDGGKFLAPEFVPVGGSPWGLAIIDFDNSGTLDLVVGDTATQSLRPLVNKSL